MTTHARCACAPKCAPRTPCHVCCGGVRNPASQGVRTVRRDIGECAPLLRTPTNAPRRAEGEGGLESLRPARTPQDPAPVSLARRFPGPFSDEPAFPDEPRRCPCLT